MNKVTELATFTADLTMVQLTGDSLIIMWAWLILPPPPSTGVSNLIRMMWGRSFILRALPPYASYHIPQPSDQVFLLPACPLPLWPCIMVMMVDSLVTLVP